MDIIELNRGSDLSRTVTWPGEEDLSQAEFEVFEASDQIDGKLSIQLLDAVARTLKLSMTLSDDEWAVMRRQHWFRLRATYGDESKKATERMELRCV